jgi:2-polyprenyl-3-methyl-5-hydroxy-6-metoxy-1,4-benzoquinol methylase
LGATGQLNAEGKIREEFDRRISEHLYNYYWRDLGLFDWQERIEARKNEVPRAKSILQAIETISGIQLKGKRMLDIGCGWGGFVVAGLEMGMEAYGCDVDREALEVAKLRARLHNVAENFVSGAAEKLPFADEEFDYVQSITVLEHVDDVTRAIKEFMRVLKKNGAGFIQAPNYWQPIERHYKVLFLPKCPRVLGKMCLALLARPTEFLDTVNYIDYKTVKTQLQNCGAQVQDIEQRFQECFRSLYKPSDAVLVQSTGANRSYNALVTKIMWRLIPPVMKFVERILNIRQMYFLVRKN